jgi:hypothetical protein
MSHACKMGAGGDWTCSAILDAAIVPSCLVPECGGTHAVRTAIQRSKAPLKELAARYGLNHKTVAKWRKRSAA